VAAQPDGLTTISDSVIKPQQQKRPPKRNQVAPVAARDSAATCAPSVRGMLPTRDIANGGRLETRSDGLPAAGIKSSASAPSADAVGIGTMVQFAQANSPQDTVDFDTRLAELLRSEHSGEVNDLASHVLESARSSEAGANDTEPTYVQPGQEMLPRDEQLYTVPLPVGGAVADGEAAPTTISSLAEISIPDKSRGDGRIVRILTTVKAELVSEATDNLGSSDTYTAPVANDYGDNEQLYVAPAPADNGEQLYISPAADEGGLTVSSLSSLAPDTEAGGAGSGSGSLTLRSDSVEVVTTQSGNLRSSLFGKQDSMYTSPVSPAGAGSAETAV